MRKYVKYIMESLFDDDFDDDLLNNDQDNTLANKLAADSLPYCQGYLYKDKFESNYSSWKLPHNREVEKKIYSEADSNMLTFYYKEIGTGSKIYVTDVYFDNIEEALKFINEIDSMGFTYVLLEITVDTHKYSQMYNDEDINRIKKYIIDFKNIIFTGYKLDSVTVKNMYVDMDKILPYCKESQYNVNHVGKAVLTKIYIENLLDIQIKSVNNLILNAVYGLKDFSFIKRINDYFYFVSKEIDNLPETCNLTGLPNQSYDIQLEYLGLYTTRPLKNTINFVGLPDKCTRLHVRISTAPQNFLYLMSFEGITLDFYNSGKFEFSAHYFPGRGTSLRLLIGPFLTSPSVRVWKPNKPHMVHILKTHDWFLDCYYDKDGAGPHKQYKIPNDLDNKEYDKLNKKLDDLLLKIEDINEDIKLMTKKLHETVVKGGRYFSQTGFTALKITDWDDDKIHFWVEKKFNRKFLIMTYANFFKWLLKSFTFIVNTVDDTSLQSLVIDPVIKRRDRINKNRKEKLKEKRAQEKIAAKKENECIKKEEKEIAAEKKMEKILSSKPTSKVRIKKIPKEPENNSNIKIYDYSDRAIAIYGDTFKIKDKLKELGCKYNKFLNINGLKIPGWIVSNKKKDDVQKIIDNL